MRRRPRRAFVAMSFDASLFDAWKEGFDPALRDCGYEPLRMDLAQHNEFVNDKMLAEIRGAGLVVADFTHNRSGVYFEAGFALGLGLPVVWTCREDELKELHFDTRNYHHVAWTTPAELRERLRDRVLASIGPPKE